MVRSVAVNDFLSEAAENGVVIDVRTPAEFEKGHIIGAVNIPLFTNEERVVVGTLYIRVGREQAIEKGLEFVGGRMADMVRQAKSIAAGRPVYVYCWRGGMRSGSVGWLFATAGMTVATLKGGYKAYRRSFEQLLEVNKWNFLLLSGSTGCGKTELLHRIADMGEQVLDLEGLANHKGSAFGGLGQEPQPTTEHFINKLHHRFRQLSPSLPVWCEAESVMIGGVFLPAKLYEIMHSGVEVRIEMEVEQRLDRLMIEYGEFSAEQLTQGFLKIAKRFGPEQTKNAVAFVQSGEIRSAAAMGLMYYDKCYKKSADKQEKMIFTADNTDMMGSAKKLIELLGANPQK